MKQYVIYDNNGNQIGVLADDLADDEKDAVLTWADEWLIAELKDVKDCV